MADLFLPPGVRYTCLRCGACCRSLEVTLTEAERERLLSTGRRPVPPGLGGTGILPVTPGVGGTGILPVTPGVGGTGILPVTEAHFARIRGARGKQVWRLRPTPHGACPFLGEGNLCRVHATLGYEAKPFAGRLFPFHFVVTPVGAFVGCRFSCPAVARGLGRELEEQRGEIKRLFDEYAATYQPPTEDEQVRFFGHYKLAWRDILRIEDQLLAFLLMPDLDVPRRLLACVRLVRQFVAMAVRRRQDDRVGADPEAILAEVRGDLKAPRLGLMERLFLRLATAAFVGATPHYYHELPFLRRLGMRLRNLARRLKMALGVGRVRLPGIERPVRLREVWPRGTEAPPTILDAASAAMLQRYFVAKVSSQSFFGRACFGRSFAQGFEFLATACIAILWLASAHALAAGRRKLDAADAEYGIGQVDYGYNHLREFGGLTARARAALLWHWGTAAEALASVSRTREPGGLDAKRRPR